MKKKFPLILGSLEKIFDFMDSFKAKHRLDDSSAYIMNLSIEELFTNMIKYDHKENGEVEISLEMKDHDLIISITDFDVPKFDITRAVPYDLSKNLKQRPIGKLGIHFIKSMMDEVNYIYENNNSTIIMKKHMRNAHV